MKIVKHRFNRYKLLFAKKVSVNNSLMNDVVISNIRRIFYATLIWMPISLINIIIFSVGVSTSNETQAQWRIGIIISNLTVFFLAAGLACITFFLRKKEKSNGWMVLIQNIAIVSILIFGATITTIDQLVTSSITPFLIACTIIGAIFLLRPMHALITYAGILLFFYYSIGLTQANAAVLVSDRVNGITAVGLGIIISMILWKTNASNIIQKRFILKQQKELEEKNQKLEYFAFYDSMTGLYNRRKFEELFEKEEAVIRRQGYQACVIMLDIDHFKKINDDYGHPVGDKVIKQIAHILRKNMRAFDIAARWGGEEFVILLPRTSLSEGKNIAENLRVAMEQQPVSVKGLQIQFTASFGLAKMSSDENNSLELIYREVDKALYRAKEMGRNCVVTA